MPPSGTYPIGTPGQPWGDAERATWRSRQTRQRSYADDVLTAIERLRARFDVVEYGGLDYAPDAIRCSRSAAATGTSDLPIVLVTGGVHGYETSGVHGALQFVEQHAARLRGPRQPARRAVRQPVGLRAHPPLESARDRSEPFVPRGQPCGRVGGVDAPGRAAARALARAHRPARDHRHRRDRVPSGARRARRQAVRARRRFPTASISSTTARIRSPNSSRRSSPRSRRSRTSRRRTPTARSSARRWSRRA